MSHCTKLSLGVTLYKTAHLLDRRPSIQTAVCWLHTIQTAQSFGVPPYKSAQSVGLMLYKTAHHVGVAPYKTAHHVGVTSYNTAQCVGVVPYKTAQYVGVTHTKLLITLVLHHTKLLSVSLSPESPVLICQNSCCIYLSRRCLTVSRKSSAHLPEFPLFIPL